MTPSYWQPPVRTPRMMRDGADTWPNLVLDSECTDYDRWWLEDQGWTLIVEPAPAEMHRDMFGGETRIMKPIVNLVS